MMRYDARMRLASSLVVLAACGGSARAPVRASPPPACKATIDDRSQELYRLIVNGVDIDETLAREPGPWPGLGTVVYPRSATSVLVSWTIPGHYGAPAGSERLLEVDCANPKAKRVVFTLAGADLGHSALTADGKTLYFSGPDGIAALDLPSMKVRAVTTPPTLPQCRDDLPDEYTHPYRQRDAVISLDEQEDALLFQRGGNCGSEGDWEAATLFLDHPAHPTSAPRAPRPAAAVAVDAKGVLWASDGSCSEARLWHSADRGTTWSAVKIAEHDSAPGTILPDARRADHLAVLTGACDIRGPTFGERIYVTADGGATWTDLPYPSELGEVPPGHAPLGLVLGLKAGSTDHLVLWGKVDGDEETKTWESGSDAEGVAEWTVVDPRPAPRGSRVELAGETWSPSRDGLLRTRGKVITRVFLPR